MLKAHFDACEKALLARSLVPANAGHMLHRGSPREWFVSDFLTGHLSAKLAIGTGEIIDANSAPRASRNQYDIVIYKADYPRIDLGGGISAFLAESVVATIEIKSLLTQAELLTAAQAASNAKRLSRNMITTFTAGYTPPGIISYLVAFDGPANAMTVQNWLVAAETSLRLNQHPLPPTLSQRLSTLCEGLDGVFCLGKHRVIFDNHPVSTITDQNRAYYPNSKRSVIQSPDGNLFHLFLNLTSASANASAQWADLDPYVRNVQMQVQFMP